MNNELLNIVSKTKAYTSLKEKKGDFVVDDVIGTSLLFATLFNEKKKNYLILASNLYNAQKITSFISSIIGDENVLLFPFDDVLRCELLSSSKELLSQRLFVLGKLLENKPKVVIAHAASLITPLPDVIEFKNNIINLKVGEKYDIDELRNILIKSGYLRVNKIDQSLQFASRGDILDIFSINYDRPIRIEFFDDEIDCIHFFDISSQRSIEAVDNVNILPANDTLIKDSEINKFKTNLFAQVEKDAARLAPDKADLLRNISELDYEKISTHQYSPRNYKYYQYIKNHTSSLVDYTKFDIVFVANEKQFFSTVEFLEKEARNYFEDLNEQGKLITHLELYKNIDDVLKYEKCILHANEFRKSFDEIELKINPIVFSKDNLNKIDDLIFSYLNTNEKLLLLGSNKMQIDTLKTILQNKNLDYEILDGLSLPEKKIGICLFGLEEGFELVDEKICVLSSKELFGFHYNSKIASKYKEASIVKNYEDLKPGDYVVHEYYGIGKFVDIETIEIEGIHRDFLHIEYAGGDTLHVPLSQFRLVRKYAGREGAAPKLSSLNGSSWEKTKARIKERVNLLADRLFKLYSERAHIQGFSFKEDDAFQKQFENEFPYELTKDQKTALDDIKKDMQSPYAMDRLLCGDVGFGKTEVAFRAIFKAIDNGKQAAILCPTTLLARQHYELAVQRFRNFGVNIAIISRLIPEKKQKEYMEGIKDGSIHLVIGTHRLLSKNFEFKDLGLLVVDEEQRFGVEQKELIKEMKNNVDVLSLSATPIPRTMQLSLVGVRPVSQINTAPNNRNTIQTYVAPYKLEVVKELLERELSRRGQVFYIHNVVSTIKTTSEKIKRLVPSANVAYVHGQMLKEDIEDVMMRFYNAEIDILIATSIVENGIDVPNANLIIVEDADHFGLSQLYQIKGRVGRGNKIAYAYLFYKEEKALSDVASKRLKAIQDFAELGSGYKIAQRDLMIRGAGDILGPEQAGFIDSIGLDLYLKLMNEVVEEKKTGIAVKPPKPVKLLKLDAYIPGEYASKEDKIQLYQEIENAHDLKSLEEIKNNVRDIYGRLPSEVSLLFKKRRIDILLEGEEFSDISEQGNFIVLTMSKKFSSLRGVGNDLFQALTPYLDTITVTYIQKVLYIKIEKIDNWLKELETIVDITRDIYKKYKGNNDEN